MSDFVEYKPMDVEHNVKAAVENLRKAYWSNEPEKIAIAYTEAETIIVSAICHDNYTVCKPYEEKMQGEWILQYRCSEGEFYTCSQCKRMILVDPKEALSDYPFCHCGADMKGEEEE